MSDFEQRIQERIRRQSKEEEAQKQKLQVDAEKVAAMRLEREAREIELKERVTALGSKVVSLLVNAKIEPELIWEIRKVGERPRQGRGMNGPYKTTVDVRHYFHVGEGWRIHTAETYDPYSDAPHSSRHYGIRDDGMVLHPGRSEGPILEQDRLFVHDDKARRAPVRGMIDPSYLGLDEALQHLESDEFQEGVAYLLRKRKPLRTMNGKIVE